MNTEKTTDAVADPLLDEGWRKVIAEVIDSKGSQRVSAYVYPNVAGNKSRKLSGLWSSASRGVSVATSTSVRIRLRYPVVKVRIRIRPPRFLRRLSSIGFFGAFLTPVSPEPSRKEQPSGPF